ncbi:hypothetical protein ALNOE001_01660 [Candidatus Methanobinarius endosymbioticus]|uniref:Gram-positive cocci surface proteins LPxTG domain-containing protein n=1 Tax=Candidatus Methanobinarius endosymbioticus TaxID=2006182 RepID=A0A366ME26_9EURY|nr:hypothetical protein ALNOE001_01660 [Candidatus Methanobinarius endosymbioticus]
MLVKETNTNNTKNTNNTTELVDPIDPIDPIDPVDPNEPSINNIPSDSINVNASMKSTGIPIVAILLILIASLGIFVRKR